MALIYIVEDEESARETESFAMQSMGHEVRSFDCGRALFQGLGEALPQLLLLDIGLPDEDGLEIVKRLRKATATRNLPIILVTARATEMDKVRGLELGADDYVTKPYGVMELMARVKALLRRSGFSNGSSYLVGELRLSEERRTVYVGEQLCHLTYKEFELLRLLMRNSGIVVSRDTIMERIWGMDFEGESRTLDMHIRMLRRKLGEAGAMIKTVRSVGYQLEEPGEEEL